MFQRFNLDLVQSILQPKVRKTDAFTDQLFKNLPTIISSEQLKAECFFFLTTNEAIKMPQKKKKHKITYTIKYLMV